MNGAYGRRRYGFSSTRVTVNGRPSRRAASPRAPPLVEVHHAGAGPDPAGGRLEVLAGGDPVAVERDQGGVEACAAPRPASATARRGQDVPVVGGAERHPLPLPLDHDPGRHGLHPAGREPRHDLLPQHRGDLVAVEPVEDAAGLLGVDQVPVDLARVRHRRLDGRLGDLVEDHPLDRHLGLERLHQVPGDRLALAVLVRGQEDLVDLLGQLDQLVDLLLAVGGDHVERRGSRCRRRRRAAPTARPCTWPARRRRCGAGRGRGRSWPPRRTPGRGSPRSSWPSPVTRR